MPIEINRINDNSYRRPDKITTVPIKNGTVDIVSNSRGIKLIRCTVTTKHGSSEVVRREYNYIPALKTLQIEDTQISNFGDNSTTFAIPEKDVKKKFHALLMEAGRKTSKLSIENIAKINIEHVIHMQVKP